MPITLGVFAFSMIFFEVAKAIVNREIANPAHGMSPEMVTLVKRIGQTAARSSWLFRKIPGQEPQ